MFSRVLSHWGWQMVCLMRVNAHKILPEYDNHHRPAHQTGPRENRGVLPCPGDSAVEPVRIRAAR